MGLRFACGVCALSVSSDLLVVFVHVSVSSDLLVVFVHVSVGSDLLVVFDWIVLDCVLSCVDLC